MRSAPSADRLDANYRHVRRPDDLCSYQELSTVVHVNGCASVLLYLLLYAGEVKCQLTLVPMSPAVMIWCRSSMRIGYVDWSYTGCSATPGMMSILWPLATQIGIKCDK